MSTAATTASHSLNTTLQTTTSPSAATTNTIATPTPTLAIFNLRAANSRNALVNGKLLRTSTSQTYYAVIITASGSPMPQYSEAEFYLEAGTNRLKVGNQYMHIVLGGGGGSAHMAPSNLPQANRAIVACVSPIISGRSIQCFAEGNSNSVFVTSAGSGGHLGIALISPNTNVSSQAIFDAVAEPVTML